MDFVLKVSKLCNMRCEYCYEHKNLESKDQISLSQFDAFFKSLGSWVEERNITERIWLGFHGGEPLLNSLDYLEGVCSLADKYLGEKSINYAFSMQTNLTRYNKDICDFLKRRITTLGVSFDPACSLRKSVSGGDTYDLVLNNIEAALADKLNFGAITVLSAKNLDKIKEIYDFWVSRDVPFRLLPVSATDNETQERIQHLMLKAEDVLMAFRTLGDLWLETDTDLEIDPVAGYFRSAIAYIKGIKVPPVDLSKNERVHYVDTDGKMYNYADHYTDAGYLGDAFKDSLATILDSNQRKASVHLQMKDTKTCETCPFKEACNHSPLIEINPTERVVDEDGEAICWAARPMIDYFVRRLSG